MKNLVSRVAWDYLVGAVVAVTATVVVLVLVGIISLVLGRPSGAGELLRAGWVVTGLVTLLGVVLVVTLHELILRRRAQGKMLAPGTSDSRVLSREVIIRVALSGAEAGVYVTVVTVVFALLSGGAGNLSPFWVLLIGLLPAVTLIAAGGVAYAYAGAEAVRSYGKLENRERVTLLTLPLILAVTSGVLFGAATGGTAGVLSSIGGAVLTYVLVRLLANVRWPAVRRSLDGLLSDHGGPTIKVVSTHTA